MSSFQKAWYDYKDRRGNLKDSIRIPGYTGPSAQDRRSHMYPDMKWINRNPMGEGGWQEGVRREVSRGRKTDHPGGWAVSNYTDEEKRRYKLDLALARLPLELNRPLEPEEILGLVEHKDDLQHLVDTGVMPSALQGRDSLEQMMMDVKDGTKSIEDVLGEAIGDGWVPPQFAGEAKDEYYMPHAALDRLSMLDRMRSVINARLMDVPREQLLDLVDDKSMAPRVMEDWHDSTKPVGGFGYGSWTGHTPRTGGALVRDEKKLSRLDGKNNLFDDIKTRIGRDRELDTQFRRVLSSEAADLLNTMDERRKLDMIDPRGILSHPMGRANAPSHYGRFFPTHMMGDAVGPMEDMGDVEIRGQDPFSEEFQIMNRSGDSFEDSWGLVKAPLWTEEGTTANYEPEVVYDFENGRFSLVPEINDSEIAEYQDYAAGGSVPRFWESENKDARAVAMLAEGEVDDDPKEDYHQIRMFEMARDARGKGLARDRLREMIAELKEHDSTATSTHVTHSEIDTADFWDKLVDEGLIDSASIKPYVTTTPDGKLIPKTRLDWFFDRRVKE